MKTKLLKKVRKKYQIIYRSEPYTILNAYSQLYGNFIIKGIPDMIFKTKQHALDYIIQELRCKYNNLGNYNIQRKIKEIEYKVWYNE